MDDLIKAKYKNSYLIYNRKSTDDSTHQQYSLGHQKKTNLAFAHS